MPAGIPEDVYEFVKEVLYSLLPSEKDSEDVTYYVFKRIDEREKLLKKYTGLGKNDVTSLHQQIGKSVKLIEDRENLKDNDDFVALKNIQLGSYMRFKPKV